MLCNVSASKEDDNKWIPILENTFKIHQTTTMQILHFRAERTDRLQPNTFDQGETGNDVSTQAWRHLQMTMISFSDIRSWSNFTVLVNLNFWQIILLSWKSVAFWLTRTTENQMHFQSKYISSFRESNL